MSSAESGDDSRNSQVHYYADITHDGIDNDICIDCEEILNDPQVMAYIKVIINGDECICSTELGLPHVGWGEYYLVEMKNLYNDS